MRWWFAQQPSQCIATKRRHKLTDLGHHCCVHVFARACNPQGWLDTPRETFLWANLIVKIFSHTLLIAYLGIAYYEQEEVLVPVLIASAASLMVSCSNPLSCRPGGVLRSEFFALGARKYSM